MIHGSQRKYVPGQALCAEEVASCEWHSQQQQLLREEQRIQKSVAWQDLADLAEGVMCCLGFCGDLGMITRLKQLWVTPI